MIVLKVKLESNTNEVREEITESIDTATIRNTLEAVQPEEFSEGELIKVNEESGCDENRGRCLRGGNIAKNFTLKEHLKIFHDIVSANDKMI